MYSNYHICAVKVGFSRRCLIQFISWRHQDNKVEILPIRCSPRQSLILGSRAEQRTAVNQLVNIQ